MDRVRSCDHIEQLLAWIERAIHALMLKDSPYQDLSCQEAEAEHHGDLIPLAGVAGVDRVPEHDLVRANLVAQTVWKANTDTIRAEIKKLQKAMADLTGDELARAEEQLKELEARLPSPLPTISTVRKPRE